MIELVRRRILPAAYELLPREMASPEASVMLLAIGLQESRFLHRRQLLGPARGFWQFERGGLRGVLRHASTREAARRVARDLRYETYLVEPYDELHEALEHNDVLAAAMARLLLWTLPGALPRDGQHELAWQQYKAAWNPGKPHAETWPAFFVEATDRVSLAREQERRA